MPRRSSSSRVGCVSIALLALAAGGARAAGQGPPPRFELYFGDLHAHTDDSDWIVGSPVRTVLLARSRAPADAHTARIPIEDPDAVPEDVVTRVGIVSDHGEGVTAWTAPIWTGR